MDANSFFERIRVQEHLTPSEVRIVEHMEKTFPVLALENISAICNKAKVGRATVVRLVQKLGYASFSVFQQELRAELANRLSSPQERYKKRKARYSADNSNILSLHSDQIVANINELNNRIDYEQLRKAAKMLASCRSRVFVLGHRTSFAIAHLLHFGLSYLRDGVVLCDTTGGGISNAVSEISPDDILVLVFMRRYSTITEKMGHWFAERGCPVILLTDREANPLSRVASMQFVIPSDGLMGIFDSRGATVVLIETIVNLIAIELEIHLDERLKNMENYVEAFEVFSEFRKK